MMFIRYLEQCEDAGMLHHVVKIMFLSLGGNNLLIEDEGGTFIPAAGKLGGNCMQGYSQPGHSVRVLLSCQ